MASNELICSSNEYIFTVNVNGTKKPVETNIPLLIKQTNKAYHKFNDITGDIPNQLKNKVNNITVQTSDASKQIAMIILIGLLILLFLLILIIFAAIYWRNEDYVIISCLLLALFFTIVITIIIYVWTISIYNSSKNNINLLIKDIKDNVSSINEAWFPTLCSFNLQSQSDLK